ncbi:MAG: SRPBCC domain-containing protein [Bauldia sp.]|nr:SRPBCC domain-containing protein [Bauldia sp.]
MGDSITFSGVFEGKPYEDKGEILINDPPRRLAFSHFSPLAGAADEPANYHTVTFDLMPAGDATEVTLTQANLLGGVKPSDVRNRGAFETNWRSLLEKLDAAATRARAA